MYVGLHVWCCLEFKRGVADYVSQERMQKVAGEQSIEQIGAEAARDQGNIEISHQ